MKTYISLAGFDTSQILSLVVKYGLEEGDKIILIRPEDEKDERSASTVQAVKDLAKQIDRSINIDVHRVNHRNFDSMLLSLIELIKNTPGQIIANISGGPREIFLAYTIACLSQSHKITTATNFSDIDRTMNEINLVNIIYRLDKKEKNILEEICQENFLTINQLASNLQISESTASRHVSKLEKRGALKVKQKGKIKEVKITLTGKILLNNPVE
ncbi:CRISPR-associated CARF protein Csa3 [Methanohalophilus sp. DAL1]|jgi:CRISPR-associated protein Csa3|uniref:CRISPR-associated CARF protein Csa3 n=1 Tax=Methanohalophilus sp. DAL1 TaxID=1864608 RepID=UPI0025BACB37|nr:CRISPR-associated CARF protein Csa3 [Methanohalophilus sp. DAL1]